MGREAASRVSALRRATASPGERPGDRPSVIFLPESPSAPPASFLHPFSPSPHSRTLTRSHTLTRLAHGCMVQESLVDGMESMSQAKVGSALQVFFNLEELQQVCLCVWGEGRGACVG